MSIKVSIHDKLTPMLNELIVRSPGLARESLQVSGSMVAKAARASMGSMKHEWFNAVIDGKYREWRSNSGMKELGVRISHTSPGSNQPGELGLVMNPRSMQSIINFYLSPHSLTVVVGGAHPNFRPIHYENGLPAGYYGKGVKAVGSKGRAILHKMNTGKGVGDGVPYRAYGFMQAGYHTAISEVNGAIGERFKKSFKEAANTVEVKPRVRSLG